MSDYLFCISRPNSPGIVEVMTTRDDPRLESASAIQLRRALGAHALEWTLPVVDGGLSIAALGKALRRCRVRGKKGVYRCDPMTARGEAVTLTTLRRKAPGREKPGLLRRLLRAA